VEMFVWWLKFPTFASRFGGRETVKKEGEKEFQKDLQNRKRFLPLQSQTKRELPNGVC